MDEKEIIKLLELISDKLDQVDSFVKKNEWENVGLILSQVDIIQGKIKRNNPSVDTLLAQNSSFKHQYEPFKETILIKTARVIATLEEWKRVQLGKISESRNVLDGISKYYKPPTMSQYIDTNE